MIEDPCLEFIELTRGRDRRITYERERSTWIEETNTTNQHSLCYGRDRRVAYRRERLRDRNKHNKSTYLI